MQKLVVFLLIIIVIPILVTKTMPNKAKYVSEVEKRLRDLSVKTLKAEQRNKFLAVLVKKGLSTREVQSFLLNQEMSRRTPMGKVMMSDGEVSKIIMSNKLRNSDRDGKLLRKARNNAKGDFSDIVNPARYKKNEENLRKKLERIKTELKLKYLKKVSHLEEDLRLKKEEVKKLNIPEYAKEYDSLRVLRGENIKPEPKKPPVIIGTETTLSKAEIAVLSR
jgi:hypothetical protein